MISILISIHNGKAGIEDTLASIEAQTYTDWEIIAVDDGSTDNSIDILKEFIKKYPNKIIILQNNPNIGLTKSLIRATQRATGEFLARVDTGDTFERTKLEKQINFLNSNPGYGIVGCNYTNILLPSNVSRKSNVPITDAQIRKSILKRNPFAHSCIVIRKDIYEKAGGYNASIYYGQDYELWFRVIKYAKIANLTEYLCVRPMGSNSISYKRQRSQMWQTFKTRWKYINKFNPLAYFFLLEPLVVIITPEIIKKVSRRYITHK